MRNKFLCSILACLLACFLPAAAAAANPTCSGTGCSVNQDAPVWSQIMIANDDETEVAYFKYTNAGASVETAFPDTFMHGSSSSSQLLFSPRPSITYLLSDVSTGNSTVTGAFEYGAGGQARFTCPLFTSPESISGDYTVHAGSAGPSSTSGPAEYNESRLESGGKGIAVWGAFDGGVITSPKGNAVETFYYSDQECTFGGHEYGFFKDVATVAPPSAGAGVITFYISDHTNCVGSGCNASDGVQGSRTGDYTFQVTENSNDGIQYWYQAYFIQDSSAPNGYIIRVQILDPSTDGFVTCGNVTATGDSVSQSSVTTIAASPNTTGPCTFDIVPPSWYRADLVSGGSGYYFSGFQLVGDPDTVGNTPGTFVQQYKVGK